MGRVLSLRRWDCGSGGNDERQAEPGARTSAAVLSTKCEAGSRIHPWGLPPMLGRAQQQVSGGL